jgi:hypothetical protein
MMVYANQYRVSQDMHDVLEQNMPEAFMDNTPMLDSDYHSVADNYAECMSRKLEDKLE